MGPCTCVICEMLVMIVLACFRVLSVSSSKLCFSRHDSIAQLLMSSGGISIDSCRGFSKAGAVDGLLMDRPLRSQSRAI